MKPLIPSSISFRDGRRDGLACPSLNILLWVSSMGGDGVEKCYEKTGMKIYDLQDIRDMVRTSGRATTHMTVDTAKSTTTDFGGTLARETQNNAFCKGRSSP